MKGREIDSRLDRPMEDDIINDEERADIGYEILEQIENGEISNHDEVYFVMNNSMSELIAKALITGETVHFDGSELDEWRELAKDRLIEVGVAQEIKKIEKQKQEFLQRA